MGTQIPVAGKQRDLIDVLGELHRIDREFDIRVALDLAAAAGVDEFFRRLGDNGVRSLNVCSPRLPPICLSQPRRRPQKPRLGQARRVVI
jgi:hypothetical protein